MKPTISELIERSKKGDTRAFQELSRHFDDRVLAYLSARLRSRDDALDLLQHVLIDLWKGIKEFRYSSDPEFFGFVFLIARRRLYRSWGEDESLSLDEVPESEYLDTTPTTEGLATDIEEALHALDKVAQEIVSLKHWSRYSFKEIGEMLGMEEGAIRVRHHRAMKRLATLLKDYE